MTSPASTAPAGPGVQEEELGRAELLCRTLLRGLPGAIVLVFDHDLRVVLGEGDGAEERGLRTDQAAGRPIAHVLPPASFAKVEPHYRAVLAGEERRFAIRASTGADLRFTAMPVRNAAGAVIAGLAIARDETDVRRTHAELERRLAQQAAVARLGELALRRTPLDELMPAATEVVSATLDVPLSSLYEHLGGGVMAVRAATGWPTGTVGSTFEMASYRDTEGRERYAGGPVIIADLPHQPEWRARNLRAEGVVSSASVIVGDPAAPFGLLGAHARELRHFSAHDLDFLHAVAHVVAEAVQHDRTEARMRHDALHDALTGLPNRVLLADHVLRASAAAGRQGRLALLCVDLDHLKVINDSLGHRAGDELLQGVARRLREAVRPGDVVARFAGDGFLVLCDGVDDVAHAERIADRLLGAFEQPFTVAGTARVASASVGVVLAEPGEPEDAGELIANAEAAMYRAKARGRGRHELFEPGLRAEVRARLRTEDDLRRALARGAEELWIAYQPIHRVADRRLASVEALVRWRHPERGEIGPGEFVPVAEESGLIVPLGAHVLRTACRQVARWRATTPCHDLTLSVNVSARQVGAPGLVETVARALAESGLPPASLALEITEGLLLEDSPATARTLRGLQALGLRLVLDDFGTGYSSLGYLRRYPLDGLKVDRAFVADLGEDGAGDGAIVAAIVGMARALGMPTIPEGVETEAQLARLAALGCDFAQGFHLARPLPAEELEALLRAGTVLG